MIRMPSAIIKGVTICLLFLSPVAQALEIMVIDESLDTLPAGYAFWTSNSTNATANIQIGDLGSSYGLIFDGSWDVPASGSEDSIGVMYKVLQSQADFQFDPRDIEGIAHVHWTLDAEVISSTMVAPEQGIFVQLIIYQEQGDGTVLGFVDSGHFVETGESVKLDVIAFESDFGPPGGRPDFSATGLPIAFALQIGATYPRTTTPDAFFVDGRLTGDNWTVAVKDAGGIFRDSFEAQIPGVVAETAAGKESAKQVDKGSCRCPAPPPALMHSLAPNL